MSKSLLDNVSKSPLGIAPGKTMRAFKSSTAIFASMNDLLICCLSQSDEFQNDFAALIAGEICLFEAKADGHLKGACLGNILAPAESMQSGWGLECVKFQGVWWGFNLSPEWMLDDDSTMFIECGSAPPLFRFTANSIFGDHRIPVFPSLPLRLSFAAACHRCSAYIVVDFYDEEGLHFDKIQISIKPAPGGRDGSGYNYSELEIRTSMEPSFIEVSIVYDKAKDAVVGLNSFVFVSKLRLDFSETSLISPRQLIKLFKNIDCTVLPIKSYISYNRNNLASKAIFTPKIIRRNDGRRP